MATGGQKLFDAALRRAIAQGGAEQVRQAAESLLISASSGVPWAIQMLADRLDGKSPQSLEVKQTKSIDDLSLDELRDRVATLLAGAQQPDSGSAPSSGVH